MCSSGGGAVRGGRDGGGWTERGRAYLTFEDILILFFEICTDMCSLMTFDFVVHWHH